MTNSPSFIPGLHFFCDHRCWRCGLADRCAVFARWVHSPERRRAADHGPTTRVAAALAVSLQVTMETITVVAVQAGVPPPVMPVMPVMPDREMVEVEPDPIRQRVEDASRDPLVAGGSEYAHRCWPVLRALAPILAARGDATSADAAERLEETCATIASKIFRAVSSAGDPDFTPEDRQSDANGSAKIALLLIEESRQAWRVLMQPGRAAANGVPARLVASLDSLEAELLKRFPHALEFVRPGFDTGAEAGESGQIAQALLGTGRAVGTA